jgi:hypothetical protein
MLSSSGMGARPFLLAEVLPSGPPPKASVADPHAAWVGKRSAPVLSGAGASLSVCDTGMSSRAAACVQAMTDEPAQQARMAALQQRARAAAASEEPVRSRRLAPRPEPGTCAARHADANDKALLHQQAQLNCGSPPGCVCKTLSQALRFRTASFVAPAPTSVLTACNPKQP